MNQYYESPLSSRYASDYMLRKVDSRILNCLSSIAQSCCRMANDIRLLQHDRQVLHEIIRRCSMEATAKMKNGEECDLLKRLAEEAAFGLTLPEMEALLEPGKYTGRCAAQVDTFLKAIEPLIGQIEKASAEINL